MLTTDELLVWSISIKQTLICDMKRQRIPLITHGMVRHGVHGWERYGHSCYGGVGSTTKDIEGTRPFVAKWGPGHSRHGWSVVTCGVYGVRPLTAWRKRGATIQLMERKGHSRTPHARSYTIGGVASHIVVQGGRAG